MPSSPPRTPRLALARQRSEERLPPTASNSETAVPSSGLQRTRSPGQAFGRWPNVLDEVYQFVSSSEASLPTLGLTPPAGRRVD